MKSLVIIGRRWFQKTFGNTYHTATIIVDGKCVCHLDRHYGYGNQYEQTAQEWLQANGYIKPKKYSHGGSEPLWQYCKRKGISLHSEAIDVGRKQDL
jgi:hypothetical protein